MNDELPINEEKKKQTGATAVFFSENGTTGGQLNRVLHPINEPMVRRSAKLRDNFVVGGTSSVSTTTTTVSTDSHGTTETNLTTYTLNAGELYKKMVLRLTATGTYTSDATRTVTVRVGSGSAPTTEWNSMSTTAAAATNAPWSLTFYGIVATIGTSGTLEAQLLGNMNNVSKNDANTATVSINTTGQITVAVTAQWSDTTAGNSLTMRQMVLEILN